MRATSFESSHSGRDSLRTLTGAGIQATGMSRSLSSLALDTRFPAGMTHFFTSVANKTL
ncbi:MAG: hypothetical protein ABL903_03120 [Methylococcales bacterium]